MTGKDPDKAMVFREMDREMGGYNSGVDQPTWETVRTNHFELTTEKGTPQLIIKMGKIL